MDITTTESAAVRRLSESTGDTLIYLGRSLAGHYIGYQAESLEDTDTVLTVACAQNAWVRRLEADEDGTLVEEMAWALPNQESEPLDTLFVAEQWEDWDTAVTDADDMTLPEYDAAVTILHQFMEHGPHGRYVPFENLIAVTHDRARHEFTFYEIPALHPALGVTATDLDTPAEEAARAWLNVTTYGWSRDPHTHDVSFAFLDESSVDITNPAEEGRTEIEQIIGGAHPSRTNILRTDRPPLAMLSEYLQQVDAHNESAHA